MGLYHFSFHFDNSKKIPYNSFDERYLSSLFYGEQPMKKIAFFDIDGTLTSEIDGFLPESAINAIRRARTFGHLMFINTGRCFQNVEPRFRRIGFDGYVCAGV